MQFFWQGSTVGRSISKIHKVLARLMSDKELDKRMVDVLIESADVRQCPSRISMPFRDVDLGAAKAVLKIQRHPATKTTCSCVRRSRRASM